LVCSQELSTQVPFAEFFLDDMVVDADADFQSSPFMAENDTLDSNSNSSDPGPDRQARKSTSGLVNDHPTMSGMFGYS